MRDNIMFWPAVVLMVVEAIALVFLISEWFKAKRNQRSCVKYAHAKINEFDQWIDKKFDALKRRYEDESQAENESRT